MMLNLDLRWRCWLRWWRAMRVWGAVRRRVAAGAGRNYPAFIIAFQNLVDMFQARNLSPSLAGIQVLLPRVVYIEWSARGGSESDTTWIRVRLITGLRKLRVPWVQKQEFIVGMW